MSASTARVLMVDDEPHVLAGFRRTIGRSLDLTVAEGGPAGLAAIAAGPEFAVIITDMRMPGMSGLEFISAARARARDSVFMMLTGNADQQTAVDAINKGQIFRFLSKPCPGDAIEAAIAAAFRQHELVTAERVLLKETVTGSIRLLADALEMSDPELFRYQTAVKTLMAEACAAVGVERDFQYAIAASLCLVGLVTIPRRGGSCAITEETLEAVAATGGRLLGHIPRLASVAAMVRAQREAGDLPENLRSTTRPEVERMGAQLLRFCVDLAREERGVGSRATALRALAESGAYDARLTAAMLERCRAAPAGPTHVVRTIPIGSLAVGMVVDEDVKRHDGVLLLSGGQAVSELSIARIRNVARQGDIRATVNIREEPAAAAPAGPAATSGQTARPEQAAPPDLTMPPPLDDAGPPLARAV
jgi:CheY-like chemotaxis protein